MATFFAGENRGQAICYDTEHLALILS